MDQRNIILTGIPRSGTTLTCQLLNTLPNTIALDEPMDVALLPRYQQQQQIIAYLRNFFTETRTSLLTHKIATSKHIQGQVATNHIVDYYNHAGYRPIVEEIGNISFDKKLTSDFSLIIKHPASFTALLANLRQDFPCYAIIRNPLAILASWNSVNMPVTHGHAPAAESLDQNLSAALLNIMDRWERQIYLLSWFYQQYHQNLPCSSIIYYEDIITSGGKALAAINHHAHHFNLELANKNSNIIYDPMVMSKLGAKLLKSAGYFWHFYRAQHVEDLLRA